uniref:SAP domain-containing protein n=1 Tax=Rhizochromulina marina TaxID=1034831 RepID=A0A7S2WHW9_9STRA
MAAVAVTLLLAIAPPVSPLVSPSRPTLGPALPARLGLRWRCPLPAVSGVPGEESLVSLTVVQLKARLREEGLPVSGPKQALVERLLGHYRMGAEAPQVIDAQIIADEHVGAAPQAVSSGGTASQLGTITRVLELVEMYIGNEDYETAPPPKALLEAGEALLDKEAFEEAVAGRRRKLQDMYDGAMQQASLRRLEKASMFISGFVNNEKKKLAQQTISVILSVAVANTGPSALDACMMRMREEGFLTEDVKDYINALVQQEARKCGVQSMPQDPVSVYERMVEARSRPQQIMDSEEVASGRHLRSPLLKVLEIVRDRILVEMQQQASGTESLSSVQILARASTYSVHEERYQYLESVLTTRKTAREFVQFAEQACHFLIDKVEREVMVALSDGKERHIDELVRAMEAGKLNPQQVVKVNQANRARHTTEQAQKILRELPFS